MKRVSDLIYRQNAIDAICSVCGNDCDKSEFVYNAPQDEQVIMCPEHYVLSTLPSAQPEIVRCKDCKWGREVCGNIECFVDSNIPPEYHGYEWFCPNGER